MTSLRSSSPYPSSPERNSARQHISAHSHISDDERLVAAPIGPAMYCSIATTLTAPAVVTGHCFNPTLQLPSCRLSPHTQQTRVTSRCLRLVQPAHRFSTVLLHLRYPSPQNIRLLLHFALHTINIPCTHPSHLLTRRSLITVPKSSFMHKPAQENLSMECQGVRHV